MTRGGGAGGAPAFGGGATYATLRDGRAVLVISAPPRIDAHLLDVAHVLPSQVLCRRLADTGARALCMRLVLLALVDAGFVVDGRVGWHPVTPRHRARWQTQQTLARRWLCGELDAEVAVPVGWCCDVLGIDAEALAAAVRRSTGTNGSGGTSG